MGLKGGTVPPLIAAFIDSNFVQERFEGIGAQSDYGLREYDNSKLGVVNHITAGTGSIDVLTNWFKNGDTGASHFGIGRETAGTFTYGGVSFPVAPVHQYVPTVGRMAPWAQGVREWRDNPNCEIKVPAHLRALPPGAANPAFISIENVARAGTDGVTDAQFNSNVLIRAWTAAYFRFPITPETQLWHAEFDPNSRCFDTGWSGELEDYMQAAANALLSGSTKYMRGINGAPVPAPPTPTPPKEQGMTPAERAEFTALKNEVAQLRKQVWGEMKDGSAAPPRDNKNPYAAATMFDVERLKSTGAVTSTGGSFTIVSGTIELKGK